MQCSWNAHALWKIVPSLGAEDTKRWRKGSKFPLARYEAWHLCWCKTRSAKKKKKKWQIDSKRSFEYPHKYVIGIQKKGKVKVLQQTYRTATRTQRDGAHWGKGSWRNGGCPNQTAPLFPLLLYSFPHSPLPETSGAFQISFGSPFLPPKLGYRSRRKQESVSAAAILGVSCLNLYYFQQFLHLSISQPISL